MASTRDVIPVVDPDRTAAVFLHLLGGAAVGEEVVHQHLVQNPTLLATDWPWENVIFSKLPLGSQHVVDFAFVCEDSPGFRWHFIEIESPWCRRFTAAGDPSAALSHGLRQLHDWAAWFRDSREYVRRHFPFAAQVGAANLADPSLTLVIDRRSSLDRRAQGLLEQIMVTNRVNIISYDTLVARSNPPRLEHPERPLRMCRFAGGAIEELASVRLAAQEIGAR